MNKKPFYKVAHSFQITYHMNKKVAIYHLLICLSCGHWREVKSKRYNLVGHLFSCNFNHVD